MARPTAKPKAFPPPAVAGGETCRDPPNLQRRIRFRTAAESDTHAWIGARHTQDDRARLPLPLQGPVPHMIQILAAAEALPSRRALKVHNGTAYYRTDYLVSRPPTEAGHPACYLIEQAPDSVIPPHFHQANQFQVIVAGSGRLGRHEVRPLSVHYAGAYTPYGPICSGAEGLHYFTIRDGYDPGARFMPGARAELPPGRRRQIVGELSPGAASPARLEEVALLDPEADGLAAWSVRMPAGAEWTSPAADPGGRQIVLLVRGQAQCAERALKPFSCISLAPQEAAPSIRAAAQGADLLMLRFPQGTAA